MSWPRRSDQTGTARDRSVIQNVNDGYATFDGHHVHNQIHIDQIVIAAATLSPADARDCHDALLRYQLEEIHRRQNSRLGANPEYIRPQYFSAWATYAGRKSWKQRVAAYLDDIESALEVGRQRHSLEEIRQWRRDYVDSAATNAGVRAALVLLKTTDLETIFARLSSRDKDKEKESTYRHATRAAQWIARQVNDPQFGLALCIAGLFGSGKSRFLTEIAYKETMKGDLVIWVRPATAADTIVVAVERYLAEATGRKDVGLGDLSGLRRTEHGDVAVTFLVDDLDSWARATPTLLDELHRLVDHLSRYDKVRWVFASETNWLDVVTPVASTWRSIAYRQYIDTPDHEVSTLERATGWLDLDAANREHGLGLKILQTTGLSLPELATADRDRNAFAFEFTHLYTPLNAVMRLAVFNGDLEAAGPPLTDANSVQYVQRYWEWIKDAVARRFNAAPTALEATVRDIAQHHSAEPSHNLQLPAGVAANHALLEQLATTGLVRILTHGDELIEAPHYTLTTDFPALWGYRVSRFVDSADDPEVRRWWSRATDGSWIAESTCQFMLSHAAGNSDGSTDLWQHWMARSAPKAPMFFAAAALPESAEVRIATDCITRQGFKVRSKRELFALLRFLATAKNPEWSGPDRLRTIVKLQPTAAGYQLDPYLEWALTDVLGNDALINRHTYLETLLVLDRLPDGPCAHVAAAALARRGSLFETDQKWAETILEYCVRRSNPRARTSKLRAKDTQRRDKVTKKRRKPATPKPVPAKTPLVMTENKPDFNNNFPGLLTSMVASTMVESDGHVACRMLAQIGWWTAEEHNVALELARYMRRSLTTSYGATIHYARDDGLVDEYVAVVRDLLSGRLLSGRPLAGNNAFYLIKHSTPTHRKRDVIVRPVFHEFLDQIGADADLMRRLGSEATTLIHANRGHASGIR
ncbi:hypothetical protein [Rhodococcus erythropolis]|uniref:Uncharacterized protein n=1 Tax=Rhodococcus erythropolis (strain PR4 / NBRC 100887) TaxID=234621 RepID=C0ZYZ5_RHOE4|nr:hypothetical protein [Rhodococcus erythropolis]BAH33580.1 hypothetical protein RER_28720 [Rhodococcus erythropolis PR4]